MASTARIDELKKKFDENPRRYFAPLANEFRKAGDIEQAIVICEEFLPQQPGHMSGHIVYGQALFEAGRLPESRTVFETALALDPENLIALRHLGDIAHSQADDSSARSWYLRVLDADPRNEEIQGLIAQLSADEPAAVAAAEPEQEPVNVFAGLMDEPPAAPEPEPVAAFDSPAGDLPTIEMEPVRLPTPVDVVAAPEALPPVEALDFDFADQTSVQAGAEFSSPAHAASDFVSSEFAPLDEHVESVEGLHDELHENSSSFRPPEVPIAALEGLEGSGGVTHDDIAEARASVSMERVAADFAPELDVDGRDIPPAHGDVFEPALAVEHIEEPSLEDFEASADGSPPVDEAAVIEMVAAHEEEFSAYEFETVDEADVTTVDAVPPELPPAVIAAEAELMDEPVSADTVVADEVVAEEEASAPAVDEPATAAPFVTETMAELYLAQGFRTEALSVYQQLLSANPDDERLEGIVASLSAEPVAAPLADAGPSVRDFFSRLAARRPDDRAAAAMPPADDDFAAAPSMEAAEQYEAPVEEPVVAAMSVPVDTFSSAETPLTNPRVQTPPGSIDALFGNKPATRTEDSAAAALAQAFGGATEDAPALTGRPAHAASGELTLDSVFRDAPTRAQRVSQNFSFDQFFAGGAVSGERSSGTPTPRSTPETLPDVPSGERGADDIDQFNSWLQGLKPR